MSWLDTLSEIRSTDWSKVPEPERERKAAEVVTITSYASAAASGAASVVPVPAAEPFLLGVGTGYVDVPGLTLL